MRMIYPCLTIATDETGARTLRLFRENEGRKVAFLEQRAYCILHKSNSRPVNGLLPFMHYALCNMQYENDHL